VLQFSDEAKKWRDVAVRQMSHGRSVLREFFCSDVFVVLWFLLDWIVHLQFATPQHPPVAGHHCLLIVQSISISQPSSHFLLK